jgi:hypothetical protein
MSRKFLTHLDLAKNELQNAVAQNLASAPSSPVKGQFYLNTTDNVWYWWNGTTWIAAQSGAPTLGNVVPEPTFGSASANGAATSVSRSDHAHGNPVHDAAAHSAIPLSALAVPTGALSMNGQRLTNLGTPTAGTDGTTKDYVDNLSAGLSWKDSVRAATTANITRSAPQTIDGVSVIAGDRVLVKNQTAPAENGIFVVAAGAWTRATDADAADELLQSAVFVSEGTTQADTAWVMTTNAPITVNTTGLAFVQFGAADIYTAGAGMTQTGNVFDVIAGNASLLVSADSLAVAFASSGGDAGTALQPARGDHLHAATYVPLTRTISTTAPLTGGGDLSANRTLGVSVFASGASGIVPASGGNAAHYLSADGTWKAVPLDTAAGDARYTRKFSQSVGGAVTATVTHNLNTRDVDVDVYRVASPYDTVECDVERTDANTVTLRFSVAPAASEYRCVVVG